MASAWSAPPAPPSGSEAGQGPNTGPKGPPQQRKANQRSFFDTILSPFTWFTGWIKGLFSKPNGGEVDIPFRGDQ